MRGKSFTCTVTGSTPITDTFHRVHLHGPELLQAIGNHPTMWARFWFRKGDRPHQRAFTLVNAQQSEDTFDVDVHLHGGTAGLWSRTMTPDAPIDATLQQHRGDGLLEGLVTPELRFQASTGLVVH